MRRPLLSPLLPLYLALGGCLLEPDDPVYLSGTALEADGTPWRGGPLTLMRPRKTNIRLNYEPWAEVAPDAQGLFLHRLTARDTGADGMERPHPWTDDTLFQLHLPPRGDGARDFLSFQMSRDVDLPPLRPWSSNVRGVEEAGGVRLSWDAVRPTADIPEPEYYAQLKGETGLAWRLQGRSGEPWFDAEMMEDFTDGRAHVQAVSRGHRAWFDFTLYYNAVSEAPPLPLPLPLRGPVPASRGAGCSVKAGPMEPCPLTDGRLESTRVRRGATALSRELFLHLREPVRPRRVLLRGLNTSGAPGEVLHVEGSVDGETWTPLGDSAPLPALPTGPYVEDPATEVSGEYFVDVPLTPDAPEVSHLRLWVTATWLEFPGGPRGMGYISALREVSVFAAPQAATGAPARGNTAR